MRRSVSGPALSEARRRRVEGFTLVEILIVIIIIGILASLTLVGVMHALRVSRRNATDALVQQLRAACETYRTRWGDYPPTTLAEFKVKLPNDTNNGAEALCACLSSQNGGGIIWQPVDVEGFGNVDNDKADKNVTNWHWGDNSLKEILDTYRQPVAYIHHKDYARAAGALTKYKLRPQADEVHSKPVKSEAMKAWVNPDKFQIVSAGEDGVFGTADDVTGW